MKKLFLGLAAVALLAGCSNGGGAAETTKVTGVGTGMGGEVKVEVEFEGDKIVSVNVVEHKETEGISDPAIEELPAKIVEANGTEGVEVVSGATITSNAIIDAVNDAIEQNSAK